METHGSQVLQKKRATEEENNVSILLVWCYPRCAEDRAVEFLSVTLTPWFVLKITTVASQPADAYELALVSIATY